MSETPNAYVETDATGLAKSTAHAKEVADRIDYVKERGKLADKVVENALKLNMDKHTVDAADVNAKKGITQIIKETITDIEWSTALLKIIYKHIFTEYNETHDKTNGIEEANVIEEGDIIWLENGRLYVTRKPNSVYANISCTLLPTPAEMAAVAETEEEEEEESESTGTADTTPSKPEVGIQIGLVDYQDLLDKPTWTAAEALSTGLLAQNENGDPVPCLGWDWANSKTGNYKVDPKWDELNAKPIWCRREAIFSGLFDMSTLDEEEALTIEGYEFQESSTTTDTDIENWKIVKKTSEATSTGGLVAVAPAATESTTTETTKEKPIDYETLLKKDTWTKAEAIASTLLVKDSDGKNYTSLYGWGAADKNAWDKGTNYKLVPHWETLNQKESWTAAEAVFSGYCVKTGENYYPKEGYTYHKAKGDDYKIYALPSTEANEQGPAKVDTRSPNLERNNHRLIQDKIKTEFGKEEGDCSVSLEKDSKQTISFPIAYKGYDLGQIKVEKKDGGKWSIGSMEYDNMLDAANDAVLARKALTYVLTNKIAPEAKDKDDPFYAMPVLSQLGFAAEGRDMQVAKDETFGGKLSIKGDSSEFVDDINKRYSEYVQKTELFDKETWSFEEAVDSELTYTKEENGEKKRYAKIGYKWAEIGNKDNMKVLPDSSNPSPKEALADNSVNWMLRVAEGEIGLKWQATETQIIFSLNGSTKGIIENNNKDNYWDADDKRFGDLKLAIIKTASKIYDEDRVSQVESIYDNLDKETPFSTKDGAVASTSNNDVLWEPIFKQNNAKSMCEKLTTEYRRIEASKGPHNNRLGLVAAPASSTETVAKKIDDPISEEEISKYTGEGTHKSTFFVRKGTWENGQLVKGEKIGEDIVWEGTFKDGTLTDGVLTYRRNMHREIVRNGKTGWATINELVANNEGKIEILWIDKDFKATIHSAEANEENEPDPYPFYLDGNNIKFHEDWSTDPVVVKTMDLKEEEINRTMQALCDIWKMDH